MKGIESEYLVEGMSYWLDSCKNESGIFFKITKDEIWFIPNEDCLYLIDEDGYVKFSFPHEGLWYLKD